MPRFKESSRTRNKEGNRLWNLRDKLGWTQERLAGEWNVTRLAITYWENGDRTIPGPVLRLIQIYEKGKL